MLVPRTQGRLLQPEVSPRTIGRLQADSCQTVSLDGATGSITGDPTTAGEYSQFTVQISDASSTDPQSVDVSESVIVSTGPLAFGSPTLPDALAGTPYEESLSATGGLAPYTWTISSGSLPEGLSLDSNGDVVGTALTAGTSTVTVTASDGSSPTAESASESVSITIDPAHLLAATAVIPPEGAVGQLYYAQAGCDRGSGPLLVDGPLGLAADRSHLGCLWRHYGGRLCCWNVSVVRRGHRLGGRAGDGN